MKGESCQLGNLKKLWLLRFNVKKRESALEREGQKITRFIEGKKCIFNWYSTVYKSKRLGDILNQQVWKWLCQRAVPSSEHIRRLGLMSWGKWALWWIGCGQLEDNSQARGGWLHHQWPEDVDNKCIPGRLDVPLGQHFAGSTTQEQVSYLCAHGYSR